MGLVFVSILSILAVEYIQRTPLLLRTQLLIRVVTRSLAVIRSQRISDHWKEIVVLRYARDLAIHTLLITIMLVGLFLLVLGPVVIADYLVKFEPPLIRNFYSLYGILTITAVALVYAIVRRRFIKL